MKSTFTFLVLSFTLGHRAATLPISGVREAPKFASFDRDLGFNLRDGTGTVPFSSGLGLDVQRNEPIVDVFAPQFSKRLDLQSVSANKLNIAPIPVPGFPGPAETPAIPGVNTIPGLDAFNYLVGSLIPQAVSPANQLLGGSLSRILPQDQTENIANRVFETLAAPAQGVEVARMMGRWFQVVFLFIFLGVLIFFCNSKVPLRFQAFLQFEILRTIWRFGCCVKSRFCISSRLSLCCFCCHFLYGQWCALNFLLTIYSLWEDCLKPVW